MIGTKSESEIELEFFKIEAAKMAKSIMEEFRTICAGMSCRSTGDDDGGEDGVHGASPEPDTTREINERLDKGEDLAATPWGENAASNRQYYIVGSGQQVVVKARNEESPNSSAVKNIQSYLQRWWEENQWGLRQAETSRRLDMHGEVFDVIEVDLDSQRVYFHLAEPQDVEEDPESTHTDENSDDRWIDILGVRRVNNVTFTPASYFIDGTWYREHRFNPEMIDFETSQFITVMHRKRNVISKHSRGKNIFWPVREELIYSKMLMANMSRVSAFQAAFGAIRTIDSAGGMDAAKNYLNSLQPGTAGSPGEQFGFPAGSVVTVPKGIHYEFPETGLGNLNHIELLVQLLRACASGLRTPEFMLTSNVSEGNFASTLVSEGPFHKGMQFEQFQLSAEDLELIRLNLFAAAVRGGYGFTEADLDTVIIELKGPRVQTRNRKEDFEIHEKMWRDSILSAKSLAALEGLEYDQEQAQIKKERGTQAPPPPVIETVDPGPKPGLKGDQLKEKGVSAGEPPQNPQS